MKETLTAPVMRKIAHPRGRFPSRFSPKQGGTHNKNGDFIGTISSRPVHRRMAGSLGLLHCQEIKFGIRTVYCCTLRVTRYIGQYESRFSVGVRVVNARSVLAMRIHT